MSIFKGIVVCSYVFNKASGQYRAQGTDLEFEQRRGREICTFACDMEVFQKIEWGASAPFLTQLDQIRLFNSMTTTKTRGIINIYQFLSSILI